MGKRKKGEKEGQTDPDDELKLAEQGRRLLIESWHSRDELYGELFGSYSSVSPENYGPPPAVITNQTRNFMNVSDSGDPGDPDLSAQHLAVLTYSPSPDRPYWMHVTAGLCSPWLQTEPAEVSGFGCELMIKSLDNSQWPKQILRSMAYYIFNHAGTLSPSARIALNGSISVDRESKLRNLFIWYADEAPDCWYPLPSGGFGLFTAVGITDDELKFAESIEEYGTWCIQEVLRRTGFGQVSDPGRASVMEMKDIGSILLAVKSFSDNFRTSKLNS